MACSKCDADCETCNVDCNTCEGCDDCENCDSCEGCDGCQKCNNGCNASCNTCQTQCQTQQVLSKILGTTFSWDVNPEGDGAKMGPDSGYFNKTVWDKIFTYISRRTEVGSAVKGGTTISASTKENVAPFSAKEFNRAANEINNNLSSTDTKATTVNSGDLIYGKYFTSLQTAVNNMRVSSSACSTNNTCTSCQSCDGCQKCNNGCNSNCDTCEGCVYCNSSCDACEGCNRCQGCISKCNNTNLVTSS